MRMFTADTHTKRTGAHHVLDQPSLPSIKIRDILLVIRFPDFLKADFRCIVWPRLAFSSRKQRKRRATKHEPSWWWKRLPRRCNCGDIGRLVTCNAVTEVIFKRFSSDVQLEALVQSLCLVERCLPILSLLAVVLRYWLLATYFLRSILV